MIPYQKVLENLSWIIISQYEGKTVEIIQVYDLLPKIVGASLKVVYYNNQITSNPATTAYRTYHTYIHTCDNKQPSFFISRLP